MTPRERFWTRRLRWRLRGATQWPAFVALTLADGVVLDMWPPVSTTGLNLIEGVLIATFANLFLVGAVAPWLARRLADRRAATHATTGAPPPGDVERDVIQDRTATALLVVGLLAVIASGLANRPVIVSETEATEINAEALSRYVARSGDEELVRNRDTANTIRLGEGYFRNCIARDDRERYFCVFIDTREDPPEVVVDDSAEPNTVFRGR
ncbi:MAG TPA: hypothetical protein VHF90_10710 [Thermoleophilaceae bacterium]|nr:hypothetical protein [Thermoleophilaceae bacterium]